MTYKLLRHKDFTAEWEKLPVAIREQFKKMNRTSKIFVAMRL